MDHYEDNRAKEAERQAKWMKEYGNQSKKKPISYSSQILILVFMGLFVMAVLNWIEIV